MASTSMHVRRWYLGLQPFRRAVRAAIRTLTRAPRWASRQRNFWNAKHVLTLACAAAAIAFSMYSLDGLVDTQVRRLPSFFVAVFREITDFGKSGWLLVPLGALFIVATVLSQSATVSARVMATLAVRFGFLFSAIALPGLAGLAVKGLIGRARPYAAAGDPNMYNPLVWRPEFASLPSGHSTTAFAAAVAVSAVWPQLRVPIWLYACTIALSRVIVSAHFPSDVIASAVVGVTGAMLVRDYFAARGLAFRTGADGRAHALPGPSRRRINRAINQLRSLYAPDRRTGPD